MKQQLSKLILDTMFNPDEFLREIDQMISEQFEPINSNEPLPIINPHIRDRANREEAIECALKTFLSPSLEIVYRPEELNNNPYLNIAQIFGCYIAYILKAYNIAINSNVFIKEVGRKTHEPRKPVTIKVLHTRHLNYANKVYSMYSEDEHSAYASTLIPDEKFNSLFKVSLNAIKKEAISISTEELRLLAYKIHFWSIAILQGVLICSDPLTYPENLHLEY